MFSGCLSANGTSVYLSIMCLTTRPILVRLKSQECLQGIFLGFGLNNKLIRIGQMVVKGRCNLTKPCFWSQPKNSYPIWDESHGKIWLSDDVLDKQGGINRDTSSLFTCLCMTLYLNVCWRLCTPTCFSAWLVDIVPHWWLWSKGHRLLM